MYAASIVAEKHARSFEICGCKKCQNRAMSAVASKEKKEKKILPVYQETRVGFKIPNLFSIDAFESALRYRPRPDDLFIVTYPKCGTTWVQNIVACIFKEGKPFESALEFLSNTPFLEMAGAEAAETMKRPGAIKLHLPFQHTPWSDEAKYIFVARNPKDCCVSFYHHTRNISGYKFRNGSFDDYFELFIEGKVDFGDYFDCLLSWYHHRNDPNVLFITYEQIKKDTRSYVMKIAEFMGQKYKDMLEKNEEILDNVIKYSSFNFMKEHLNKQVAELAALPRDFINNHPDIPQGIKALLGTDDGFFDSDPNSITFVRRGIVGDWKNHFTPDQNKRLEDKFKERTKGTDLAELWKDDMLLEKKKICLNSQIVNGLKFPVAFSPAAILSAMQYKPADDDIFIVTYPKCGTTWAQYVINLIFRQGDLKPGEKIETNNSFLELKGMKSVEDLPRPRIIKTHLPYSLCPRSDKTKYVFIARNPKDCCVSFYYHMKNHNFEGTFDDFFEIFITGETLFGDYFDHLLSWYNQKHCENIFMITYEEMKKDIRSAILKMAEFINENLYTKLQNNAENLGKIEKFSSFSSMKEVFNSSNVAQNEQKQSKIPLEESSGDEFTATKDGENKQRNFIRKGIVGDWKNHFSNDQSNRLNSKLIQTLKGTDILNWWKEHE